MVDCEELPSWLAWPAARCAPGEGPISVADARELVAAFVEYATVMLLADGFERSSEVDLRVEGAMRLAMNEEMDFDAWRTVFEALLASPRAKQVVGVAADFVFPSDHPVNDGYWAASGDVEESVGPGQFLAALSADATPRADAGPALRAAALALIADAGAIHTHPLCLIRSVAPHADGFEVNYRKFAGTGFPTVRSKVVSDFPQLSRGLYFWDEGARAVAVPEWLVCYDEAGFHVRFYGGREPVTRQWRYPSRIYNAEVLLRGRVVHGAPVYLSEPTWQTPAPAERRGRPLREEDFAAEETVEAHLPDRLEQVVVRSRAPVPPAGPRTGRYVLKILSGRGYLRFHEIGADDTVTMGRNPAFASFVIPHGEVSRSNTRVWTHGDGALFVQDLKSTNGTLLNGEPIGQQATPLKVHDVLSVGPVPVVVEAWDAQAVSRLRQLEALHDEEERDPLTGLLKPRYLVTGLSASLAQGFGETDEVTGLLVTVDRLAAIHAQHGSATADTVFQNVARGVMHALDDPSRCVRVGYGEIFAVLIGVDARDAKRIGEAVVGAFDDHLWEASNLKKVTLSASYADKRPAESAEEWISRARRAVQEGRLAKGDRRVYRSAEG